MLYFEINTNYMLLKVVGEDEDQLLGNIANAIDTLKKAEVFRFSSVLSSKNQLKREGD